MWDVGAGRPSRLPLLLRLLVWSELSPCAVSLQFEMLTGSLPFQGKDRNCLLYTSDAADDL